MSISSFSYAGYPHNFITGKALPITLGSIKPFAQGVSPLNKREFLNYLGTGSYIWGVLNI
jgi:hypothetical protein